MQSAADVILNILVWPYLVMRFLWHFFIYRADCPHCGYRVKNVFGKVIHSQQECARNKAHSRHYDHVFRWFVHNKKTFDLRGHLAYYRQPHASFRAAVIAFIAHLVFDFLVLIAIVIGWIGALWLLRCAVQWVFHASI